MKKNHIVFSGMSWKNAYNKKGTSTLQHLESTLTPLLCVCVYMHRHVSFSCKMARDYLLMCQSISQHCAPHWWLDSPENSPRRSHTDIQLSTHISNKD